MTTPAAFIFRLAAIALLFSCHACRQKPPEYFPDPDPAIRERLEQWQDLKFGLLMHWGAYSQWGVVESWSICPEDVSWATGARKAGIADNYYDYVRAYERLKKTFNPTRFNPEKWAAAAKDAGMKYLVFTTKHHDGFCMYDSRYTDYKITDTACPFSANPRADVTKEIFSAFRKQDFWIGAYFSKPDWHSNDYWWRRFPAVDRNPNYSIEKYGAKWDSFTRFTHNQVNELMSGYGPIDILWLDGGWVRKKPAADVTYELQETYEGSRYARNPQSQDVDMAGLVKEVRTKQPKLLVVDRGVRGIYQNYLTPEQTVPDAGLNYPWETCMTMGDSWSYKPGDRYKPAGELVKTLVDIVSKGGNYLLNIGPGPDGELDSVAYDRLAAIGRWMKTNGEAIYGTRMASVYGEGEGIRYTQSKDGKTRYVFLFDFPAKSILLNKFALPSNARMELLGSAEKLTWSSSGKGVQIAIPAAAKKASEHVWVVKVSVL